MKKLVLLLCLLLTLCPLACAQSALLTDDADLLDSWEEDVLLHSLETVQEQYGIAVVVVTVDSLDGQSVKSYADRWFDHGGYGADGLLLLVDMDSRQWYISTTGYGMTAVTDSEVDDIGENIADFLSDGDYLNAFLAFAEACEEELEKAENGDYGESEAAWYEILGICLLIGFVISLIVALCLKGQLKSVRFKPDANSYIRSGSMVITQQQDIYLYSQTTRTARPKNNGSGSSSGRSHGGGGGRF